MDLREILGTRYPIIQGAMARIATGEFAAHMAECGVMGIIAAGGLDGDALRKEIRLAKSLTDKPFGVNLMLMDKNSEACAKVIIEEGVKFVTTGAGSPESYIPAWKEAGIKVFPLVGSCAIAKRFERCGVDGVIAEGCESGGHVGELTTMALVPQIVDALNIPVVAAGGIADGRQMLAAFALGACGVQIGTSLLASFECPIHDNYKSAVIKAKDIDSVVTGRIGGTPVRILKNQMSRQYIAKEKCGAGKEELEEYTLGALSKAVFEGDIVNGSLMAGQVCGMLKEIQPAKDIIQSMFGGCLDTYTALASSSLLKK